MDPIPIGSIVVRPERMRKDMGDIDSLAKSIEENGLISPLTLVPENGSIILIAGERRLTALKKIGVTHLVYGMHFTWRDDVSNDEYRKTAIELEENIRRRSLTWHEEVLGKQKLLDIYQKIYGPPSSGQVTRDERLGLKPQGFGVRKLADLLGESATNTSEDLELAALVTKIPALKGQPTKEAARRTLGLAVRVMIGQNQPKEAKPLAYKILIECESENHQATLLAQLRGAGLKCTPIVA